MEAVHQCSTQGLQFTPAGCSPEHRKSAEELAGEMEKTQGQHSREGQCQERKKENFGNYSWCYLCRYSGRSVMNATGSSPITFILCKRTKRHLLRSNRKTELFHECYMWNILGFN